MRERVQSVESSRLQSREIDCRRLPSIAIDCSRKRSKAVGGTSRRSGSALVLVLVLTVVLSVLVLSFSYEAHLELRYVSYARKRAQCEGLAASGVEIAKLLMEKQLTISSPTDEGEEDDRWFGYAKRLRFGQEVSVIEELGGGEIEVVITPEPALRNVNLLTDDDWDRIFEMTGVPDKFWDTLKHSFRNWIDPNSPPWSDGAKSDYYEQMEPPYRVKGRALDTVRELLMIKGFTEALLTGGVLREEEMDPVASKSRFGRPDRFADTNAIYVLGFEHLLTTYGDGRVNVNSASREVLMTIPGVDEILAEAVIEESGRYDDPLEPDARLPYTNINDVWVRVPGAQEVLINKISLDSQIFRLSVTGRIGSVERRITAIVWFDWQGRRLHTYRWYEES